LSGREGKSIGTLIWIIIGGLLMSTIALVGGLTTLLRPEMLDKLLLPFVSLAAGTLLGGAFFHMIPEATAALSPLEAGMWLVGGFTTFLGLEQFLHWHQTHRGPANAKQPVTHLILIGDAIHNFIGGLAISSTFIMNPQSGVAAWIAGAMHEIPQELGDFGILVHGGYPPRQALLWNTISALTFPLGALLAYLAAQQLEVSGLVLFGAGNFIYIAASDLVPEIKAHKSFRAAATHFGFFAIGIAVTLFLAIRNA
jgi:zinc and cadmium transporter